MLCSYLSEPMRAVSENVASLTCDYGDLFSLQICGDYSSICFHFARGRNMPDTYGIIFFICRDMYLLTMLFIFEDDEPALCFLRLLTSSTFPSFGFKTILLGKIKWGAEERVYNKRRVCVNYSNGVVQCNKHGYENIRASASSRTHWKPELGQDTWAISLSVLWEVDHCKTLFSCPNL